MEESKLLNKRVRVVKVDGFNKYGILRKIEPTFIELEYPSGDVEIVSFSAIQSILLDSGGEGHGR